MESICTNCLGIEVSSTVRHVYDVSVCEDISVELLVWPVKLAIVSYVRFRCFANFTLFISLWVYQCCHWVPCGGEHYVYGR